MTGAGESTADGPPIEQAYRVLCTEADGSRWQVFRGTQDMCRAFIAEEGPEGATMTLLRRERESRGEKYDVAIEPWDGWACNHATGGFTHLGDQAATTLAKADS